MDGYSGFFVPLLEKLETCRMDYVSNLYCQNSRKPILIFSSSKQNVFYNYLVLQISSSIYLPSEALSRQEIASMSQILIFFVMFIFLFNGRSFSCSNTQVQAPKYQTNCQPLPCRELMTKVDNAEEDSKEFSGRSNSGTDQGRVPSDG